MREGGLVLCFFFAVFVPSQFVLAEQCGNTTWVCTNCTTDFHSKTDCTCLRNFVGPNCDECDPWYYGKDCDKRCPDCQNNGVCDHGQEGTGDCNCSGNFGGEVCENCRTGFYGQGCKFLCPNCNHGACLNTIDSHGQCQCFGLGFDANKSCAACRGGFFGSDCQICSSCVHGKCDDGLEGTGDCICDENWHGHLCQFPADLRVVMATWIVSSAGILCIGVVAYTFGVLGKTTIPANDWASFSPHVLRVISVANVLRALGLIARVITLQGDLSRTGQYTGTLKRLFIFHDIPFVLSSVTVSYLLTKIRSLVPPPQRQARVLSVQSAHNLNEKWQPSSRPTSPQKNTRKQANISQPTNNLHRGSASSFVVPVNLQNTRSASSSHDSIQQQLHEERRDKHRSQNLFARALPSGDVPLLESLTSASNITPPSHSNYLHQPHDHSSSSTASNGKRSRPVSTDISVQPLLASEDTVAVSDGGCVSLFSWFCFPAKVACNSLWSPVRLAGFGVLIVVMLLVSFSDDSDDSEWVAQLALGLCWIVIFSSQSLHAMHALYHLTQHGWGPNEDWLRSCVVTWRNLCFCVVLIVVVSLAECGMYVMSLAVPRLRSDLTMRRLETGHVLFDTVIVCLVFVVLHSAIIFIFKVKVMHTTPQATEDCLVDFKLIRLGHLVARGSSGKVYFGEYSGVPVAIKEQQIVYLTDLHAVINEALFLMRLVHPHIVRFHAVSFQKPNCYTITERCDSSLDVLIRSPTSKYRWSDVAMQIVLGMEFIHSLGIIHRDLKPGNVLLSGGIVKICDLGTAKLFACSRNTARLGTPAFMAPELFVGEIEADYTAAVDVYSFGIILWMLITRKVPFEDIETRNNWELLNMVKNGLRPPKTDDILDQEFELMSECWDVDPDKRPTFTQIRACLQGPLKQPD